MFQYEFIINSTSVSCPACNQVFATQINYKLPEMTISLPVEADMHRVLPYGAIRACLVTICPQCQYAWWTNTFSRHFYLPVGITLAPAIDYAKKFAHAVLTGRKNNFHSLDRAILALNGYWCAKESHQETSKWLAFTIQELRIALADTSWEGSRERYHYLLAELLRLNSQFEEAIIEFSLASSNTYLPTEDINDSLKELIINQNRLAQKQNNDAVLLTNEQVGKIFFPKLPIPHLIEQNTNDSKEATKQTESNIVDFGTIKSTTNNATLFPPTKKSTTQTKIKLTV